MLKKYKNVKSDIARASEEAIIALAKSGVKEKVVFGTDFPLTNYFDRAHFGRRLALKEQYVKDCKKIRFIRNNWR